MKSCRSLIPVLVIVVFLTMAFAIGCSNNSASTSNPTPTPVPGTTPSPTPTPGSPSPTPTPGTPGPSPTPSPSPSASSTITGRVVDSSGAPIGGTVVVSLQAPSPGDYATKMQTTADASGRFTFKNVPVSTPLSPGANHDYAIMVAARDAGPSGGLYTPALLLSGNGVFGPGDAIVPGTDVGTIALRSGTSGTLQGSVESTNTAGNAPIPIRARFAPARMEALDFFFDYPWPYLLTDRATVPGPDCPSGTACANYTIPQAPASTLEIAVFSKAGYTFSPSTFPQGFHVMFDALSVATGKPDCNPSVGGGTASVDPIPANTTTAIGPVEFRNCR